MSPQIKLLASSLLNDKMQSRDHPLNRSTRPLLERRAQPQVVASNNLQQYHYNNQNNNKKNSERKLHGFNDFKDVISRQYDSISSSHYNYNYYGSPPSPSSLSDNDFIFSDNNNSASNQFIKNKNSNTQNTFNEMNNYQQQDDIINPRINNNNNNNNSYGIENDLLGCDFSWRPAPIPPQRKLPIESTEGPFVFGIHTQNSFNTHSPRLPVMPSPAGSTPVTPLMTTASSKAKKSGSVIRKFKTEHQHPNEINTSPNSSQNQSDISTNSKNGDKERKSLMKEKKKNSKKRLRKEKKSENIQRTSKASTIKCVLVGDGAVGKTNLIVSYIQDRFIPEYIPTAFDKYNVEVKVDGKPHWVTICDTAGQDVLDPLRQLCYPDCSVVMLCFSVVKPESFKSIKDKWTPEVSNLPGAALLLVGTHSDLRNDKQVLSRLQADGKRPVSLTDAWDFAKKIDAKYIETSSFTKDRLKEVFDTAIWTAMLPMQSQRKPLWRKMLCLA